MVASQETPGEPTIEYGQMMSGGGVYVWSNDSELMRIVPLDRRIKFEQHGGGKVVRRRVLVVEDWTEVPRDTDGHDQ